MLPTLTLALWKFQQTLRQHIVCHLAALCLLTVLICLPSGAQGQPPALELLVGSGTTPQDSQIQRYDSTGNYLGVFIPPGNGLDTPRSLVYGPDGALYVCSGRGNSVLRYNAQTGEFLNTFIPPGYGGMRTPIRLIFRDNRLYVSSFGTNPAPVVADGQVIVYDAATGAYIKTLIFPGEGRLVNADDIAIGPDDNLYVSSVNGNSDVLKFNRFTGQFLGQFVVSPGMTAPRGLAFRGGNSPFEPLYLYVASASQDKVLICDGITGMELGTFVTPNSGGLDQPRQIEFGPDGNLYVASQLTNQVLRYNGGTGEYQGVAAGSGVPFLPAFFAFRTPQGEQHILSGQIGLEGAFPLNQRMEFTLYPFSGSMPIHRTLLLRDDGFFAIADLPYDFYYITVKGSKWLRQSDYADLTFNSSVFYAYLPTGDANDDNAVDIADLLLIIGHYNQALPSPGYLEGADFNIDGTNDIADLLLLIGNYNRQGD